MNNHRPNWDEMYMNMCYEVASRSPDESTHSGAFIVKPDFTPVSFGYNGFPRGVQDTPERQERPLKYKFFEHAERNAIYNAGRTGVPLVGCILYVNWLTCSDCARGIIQSGIKTVIVHQQGMQAFHASKGEEARWDQDHEMVMGMYKEAGVGFRWYTGPVRMGVTGMWSGKKYAFLGSPQVPHEVSDDAELFWATQTD